MAVVYKYRWVMGRNGVMKKKKQRISAEFTLKKRKPRLAPYMKEPELIAKLLAQRKKLEVYEAEKKERYKHEQYLKHIEKEKEEFVPESFCPRCRKKRLLKHITFKIHNDTKKDIVFVSGKCVVCDMNLTKPAKMANEEDRKMLLGV